MKITEEEAEKLFEEMKTILPAYNFQGVDIDELYDDLKLTWRKAGLMENNKYQALNIIKNKLHEVNENIKSFKINYTMILNEELEIIEKALKEK